MSRRSFVSHLECSETGDRYPAGVLRNVSEANKPLLVRYDLDRVRGAVDKQMLAERPADMWRFQELLPVPADAEIVSLGEPVTPLIPLPRLAKALSGGEILIKGEGRMPTGSFKARGLALAVTMAHAMGVRSIAMPTAGNAGAALAAYASRVGTETHVFCPEDAPEVTVREIALHGAATYRVNGLINHCGEIVAASVAEKGWFDFSTLKEPYRIEGKKAMGLELAEQLGWDVPDAIFYPTGGGTGLIGMWKAFDELSAIGWLGAKRPRMIAVQSTGCGPLVRAFDAGAREVVEPWDPVTTDLHGVRVPKPFGDRLCLDAIYESGGFATAVSDEAVVVARSEVAREEGLHLGPEGAACYAAYRQELAAGRFGRNDRAVLFNCGNGLKSDMPAMDRHIDRHKPIDFTSM